MAEPDLVWVRSKDNPDPDAIFQIDRPNLDLYADTVELVEFKADGTPKKRASGGKSSPENAG
jgi:hypothetical protein